MRRFCLFNPLTCLRKIWRRYRCFCILALAGIYFVWIRPKLSLIDKSSKTLNRKSSPLSSIIFRNLGNSTFNSKRTCIHPQLQLHHPSVKKYFYDVDPIQCSNDTNWVYIENGTLKISKEAEQRHGEISCQYSPVFRGKEDGFINSKPLKMTSKNITMTTDFMKLFCLAKDGTHYFNIHTGIANNELIHKRKDRYLKTYKHHGMNLSVLMFGFDSVSRMTWERKLPKSHEYFTKSLGGIVLEGYNIVGDGTPQALLPILTGKSETELPEARRGRSGATYVDGYPWIWKDFKNAGYVTHWTEDMARIGTFNYRMKGFKNQPVDHYMRPFYLAAEQMFSFNRPYCLGSVLRHKVLLDWIRDSFLMYKTKRKFIFGFHSEYSHENSNHLQWIDDDLSEFLKLLNNSGFLNETILILMSDHGARFHAIRDTVQGKIEERMPYFAFRFPPWFESKYPDAFRNFKSNSKTLVSPFDIHATFKHILNFSTPTIGKLENRGGISLFNEIPKDRECSHAGIAAHWCACLHWVDVKVGSKFTKRAAKEAVKYINSLTKTHRDICQKLSVFKVTRNLLFKLNRNVTAYKGSKDEDGRLAEFRYHSPSLENKVYQITLITTPGDGKYEMTYLYKDEEYEGGKFIFSVDEISRINKYGNAAHCIGDTFPHLRQYCYCKTY